MPTIDATVGGTASNSYCTVAEFSTYCDERVGASALLAAADPDDPARALITAARRMDVENWHGDKASRGQARAWPRANCPKPDGVAGGPGNDFLGAGVYLYSSPRSGYGGLGFVGWDVFPSDEIPELVKHGQMEFALYLLAKLPKPGAVGRRIKRFNADGLSVEYEYASPMNTLPEEVMQLIGGLIAGAEFMRA